MPQLDILSIVIGFILGGLFKVPWLYHWYKRMDARERHIRRLYVSMISMQDTPGSRVEDENEIVGEAV